MSRRLTQPEEIDQALRELAEDELGTTTPLASGGRHADIWSGPYVPPYRAEYIKSHGIPDQGDSRHR